MIKKFLSINLRTKLFVAIFLTSLIPLLLLGFFSYRYTFGLILEQVSENELERLTSINNQFNYFLKDIEQLTLYFYNNDQVSSILNEPMSDDPKQRYNNYELLSNLFDTTMGVKDWDANIYVIGLNGDRYFSNHYLPANYNNIREYWGIFRKAKIANGAITWDTNYSIGKYHDSEIVLTGSRIIKNPNGEEIVGYVLVDVYETEFANIYENNKHYHSEQFYLLDQQEYIISSHVDKSKVGTKLEADYLPKVMNSNSGFFNYDWNDTSSILAYHTDDHTGYKLISIIPLNEIQQKNSLIRNITLNFAVIGLIISSWLAYFLSRTITNPLYKLMGLMRDVEQGNLDIRFDSKYEDDIGIFGRRFNRMLSRLKVLLQDSYEKQVRLKDSELKALRAQINPHFLYNTLETVNWLARMEGSDDISKIVVSLGEIMRYSVKKGDDFVTLREDLKQLENYLTIQEFRYQDKFKVHFNIDETILDEPILSLLLQPLVENAIIHGLEEKIDAGKIFISIQGLDHFMEITIQDDGVGMDKETLERLNNKLQEGLSLQELGIGIENVRKRLFLSYGDQYKWDLTSTVNEGTCVYIQIPYKEKLNDV